MQKNKMNRFIQKYNLGGNVNSVRWKADGKKLTTKFVSADKRLLGELNVDNFSELETIELGIYQTDQLQKLLNVLGDDIKLSVNKVGEKPVSLYIKNGSTSVNYVLSDLSVISDPPNLKYIPTFNFSCKMDGKFMETFIRGKSALTDVDTFSFVNSEDGIDCIIGYSSTNTNRVNIPMNFKSDDNLSKPITFNANLFKEILVANKECTESLLEVSEEGLSRLTFNIDDFNVVYYLVSQDDN